MRLNWGWLYEKTDSFIKWQGYPAICIISGVSTVALLYVQQQTDLPVQYLALYAAVLYFVGRIAFAVRYKLTFSKNELLLFALVASTVVSLALQFAFGVDFADQDGVSSQSYTIAMWAFSMFYLFAGAACSRALYEKSTIISLILLGLVLVPILKAADGNLLLDYTGLRYALGMDGFTHLSIAEWVVFLLMGSYAFSKPVMRPLVIVVAVYCLFALQGRSSTAFTILTFIVFGLLNEGKRSLYTWAGIALVAFAAYLVLPIEEMFFDANQGSVDRMLLSQEGEDGSLAGRAEVMGIAMSSLPSQALYGNPAFLAKELHQMGSYIHNILSMWQFFGALPFFLMVAILVRSLIKMYRKVQDKSLSVMDEMASLLLIYSSVSVLLSKSIVFYWVWFSMGYWMLSYSYETHGVSNRSKKKRRSRSKSRSSKRRAV